jgi:two-component system response regulator FixJ
MPGERTVHVVDDDADVRRSLDRLLRSAAFEPVLYDTPLAVLSSVQNLSAGCILLDVRMPGMDGLELQRRLGDLGIRLPVIVMTGHGDIATAVRAMKAGAFDFIEKPFSDDRLMNALDRALAGVWRLTREREAIHAAGRLRALSKREREVLDGLVAGRPNKIIAYELDISVRTVEVHRARMMDRLGCRAVGEAVRLAVIASLAPPPEPDGVDR